MWLVVKEGRTQDDLRILRSFLSFANSQNLFIGTIYPSTSAKQRGG
jgi:hypothetical protein